MDKKSVFHAAGLKATPNRLLVAKILEGGECMTAREIWRRVVQENPNAGFATVYRILSALCDAGLARKLPSEKGAMFESFPEDSQPQLICSRCGKVEDIKDPALLRYNASVMKRRNLADDSTLLLYADCKRKECVTEK